MYPYQQPPYQQPSYVAPDHKLKRVGQILLRIIYSIALIVLGYELAKLQQARTDAMKATGEYYNRSVIETSDRPSPVQSATPRTVATPALVSNTKTSDEFPDALIREKLKRDYPDDYVTQKGVYDMQRDAFDYMQSLPASKIKSKVQRDYPNDFVTQKGVYDMQVESKKAMQ